MAKKYDEEVQKGALKRAREETTAPSVEEWSGEETHPVQVETTDCSPIGKLLNQIEAMEDEMMMKEKALNKKKTLLGDVVHIDQDHLEWFKSMFCYLTNPGKFYDYRMRILYTKEEFLNRCICKETVVQYIDKKTKKIVKHRYESARLWIKDKSQIQVYSNVSHVPGGTLDQSNGPFFQTLREDVHEKAFTETFLKSNAANANGMHPFDWKRLNESDCYYYTGKYLYEAYKRQNGDGAHISTTTFSQQMKDIGYVKAQKRLNNTKQADVMWVGFKRKRSA